MLYFSSGDGPFYFSEQLSKIGWLPHVWDRTIDFGVHVLPRLWIDYPFQVVVYLLARIGLNWGIIEKILWLAVISLGAYSIYNLAKYILGKKSAVLSVFLYLTNTYALFLFGGGQLGVALAYGFAPLVLLRFMKRLDVYNDQTIPIQEDFQNGLLLSLLAMSDLRVAFLTMGVVFLYTLVKRIVFRHNPSPGIRSLFQVFIIPFSISILIHIFWILPILVGGPSNAPLGKDFTHPGMVKFLSFADFSHAVSLLHPNWPENLFGKVYFLQPEFLILPILAFGALLFLRRTEGTDRTDKTWRIQILFFALLALAGAFLSKGAQEPFGEIYIWLFTHIPGFVLFRDPTKFYIFTALGYAILIPFTVQKISSYVKKMPWIPWILFVLFWCFTIRQLFLGQLNGNFKPKSVPKEYGMLKDMLRTDTDPSRTLWIPAKEKFAYMSAVHPALSAGTLFENASVSGMMTIATSSSFIKKISDAGVRYVIVPMDVEQTMFLTEYKPDPLLRKKMIQTLGQTQLIQQTTYKDIAVFENVSFAFRQDIPDSVGKQEYWSRIGLMMSISTLAVCLVVLFFRKHHHAK